MIAVIQRVSSARVEVGGETVGRIERGLAVLAAVHRDDTDEDLRWTANKLAALRVFPQDDKPLDLDVTQINGGLLLVSNFTIAADAHKGRRPSLSAAAPPELAEEYFARFVEYAKALVPLVATGRFRADMQVHLVNDGPITIILDSKRR